MPNWSSNALVVTGPADNLKQFSDIVVSLIENKQDIFQHFVPMPLELLDQGDAWYTWRTRHWGTKWDAVDADVVVNTEDKFHITFDTAWNPPENIVEFLSRAYPTLTFTLAFSEMGMAFAGYKVYHNDQILEEKNVTVGWTENYDDWEEDPNKNENNFYEEVPRLPAWQSLMDEYRIHEGG